MRKAIFFLLALGLATGAPAADRPGWPAFRETYRTLVETNTTLSAGSCTAAAAAMRQRMIAAGYAPGQSVLLAPPDLPRQGNLVTTLPGRDPASKPLLLIAHIDTVEADAAGWTYPPFRLTEVGGFFHGRGTSDGKAFAAILVDTMIRYRRADMRPRRPVRLALTCGEETPDTFNGVAWLIATHRPLIDAAFAISGGASGDLDAAGNRLALGIQAGEKIAQNFRLTATGPGGHSSRPWGTSAIGALAEAIHRIETHPFPIRLDPVVAAWFGHAARAAPAAIAPDLRAVAAGNRDPARLGRIAAADPLWNASLRDTCTTTLLRGGEAINALPRTAEANVNCRLLPGGSAETIRLSLTDLLAGTGASLSFASPPAPAAPTTPLPAAISAPATEVAARLWPGVPLVSSMATGATDGRFLNAAGIPTFGLSGLFREADGNGAHGLNERMRVRSVEEARDFMFETIQRIAER